MKTAIRTMTAVALFAAVAVGFGMGTAEAKGGIRGPVYAQSGDTIITGAPGGPYKISYDGGRTWDPYKVRKVNIAPPAAGKGGVKAGAKALLVPAR